MTTDNNRSPRARAKDKARALRADLAMGGQTISHGEALERVARSMGYRDWNTASARLSNISELDLRVGETVAGNYLKQPYVGRVVGVRELAGGAGYEVELHFDEPVDVVTWERFSSHRQRVKAMVKPDGVSWAKTSDGEPHLTVWPAI